MKNALNYYYNLNPTSIHQLNKNYRCYIDGEEYLLTLYDKENYDIDKLYELSNYLLQNRIPCHQIILNNNNEIITTINDSSYILLKIFIKNRPIDINDILFFSNIHVDEKYFKSLVKNNWYDMWTQKIDYFEYQVSQFGRKYPVIRESINYYIGLAENSISLFSNVNQNNYNLAVCHRRIKKNDSLIELYNPLNFILDNRVRDLSEFIKEQFFFSKYSVDQAKIDIYNFGLSRELYSLLFARLLFPSYYFDYYEGVILEIYEEKELLKIINKNSKYIEFLKDIYLYLRTYSNLPEIEWLIK